MNQIQVELQESMGSDRSIAEAAWTSSMSLQSKEKRTEEDVERVVRMLIKDKHASPLESVIFRFWIKMPIQTDRQHVTHRIGSHNGASGRYRTMPDEWQTVPNDVRIILNKSVDGKEEESIDFSSTLEIMNEYEELCGKTNKWYRDVLSSAKESEKLNLISNSDYKRLREFFRGVLPQNNITERVSIFNLRSFANYQKLRNSSYAQPEIRRVAQLMLDAVEQSNICPVAIKALKENDWLI